MGLFKNDVGRPSNETIKKRNIFKGICVILVLVIIGLLAYIISDYQKINSNNNNDNNINESKISVSEARKILSDTFGQYLMGPFEDSYLNKNNIINDSIKKYMAIMKTTPTTIKSDCNKIFGSYLENSYCVGYGVFVGDESKVYNREDVEKNYKYLFGKNETAYGEFYTFVYSAEIGAYVEMSPEGGDAPSITPYSITKVSKIGDMLYITLNYSLYDLDSESITLNNGEKIKVDVNYEDNQIKLSDGNFLTNENFEIVNEEYAGKLKDNVTFIFEKEDDHYIFIKKKY